jgi:hypothetical protein
VGFTTEKNMNKQPVLTPRNHGCSANREDHPRRSANRVVLCLGNWQRTAVLERLFQERGWKVCVAGGGHEARAMVREHGAALAIFSADNPNSESGWLTCWKLLSEKPGTQTAIVGELPVEQGKRYASLVGAAEYLPASETAVAVFGRLQAARIVGK